MEDKQTGVSIVNIRTYETENTNTPHTHNAFAHNFLDSE